MSDVSSTTSNQCLQIAIDSLFKEYALFWARERSYFTIVGGLFVGLGLTEISIGSASTTVFTFFANVVLLLWVHSVAKGRFYMLAWRHDVRKLIAEHNIPLRALHRQYPNPQWLTASTANEFLAWFLLISSIVFQYLNLLSFNSYYFDYYLTNGGRISHALLWIMLLVISFLTAYSFYYRMKMDLRAYPDENERLYDVSVVP